VIHSLVGTLSVKPESAARHGFYQDDARKSGFDDCAELFGQPAESEAKSIQGLVRCLGQHRGDSGMGE
jgi:rubrerythrin